MKNINWNKVDKINKLFWDQNIRQFWVDEEIPLSDDKITWNTLIPKEKELFKKILAGLTLLDSYQGNVGMTNILQYVDSSYEKSVLSYMAFMENMHAKSYSSIFSTLCTTSEINELFAWSESCQPLTNKVNPILSAYEGIKESAQLPKALVYSVFLESFLFYSGFFYPLYLAGHSKLVASNEIINLIIRDESIHGMYVGLLFQKYNKQAKYLPLKKTEIYEMLDSLYQLEEKYIELLYVDFPELIPQVKIFTQYNGNKALMNLGEDPYFKVQESMVNPIVLKGLDTKTKNHDFFSTKGNGYIKKTNIEHLSDEDFNI